ncbi:HNH endonuclease [Pseudomonas tolaasii]|uniref:HNH endonuclease n=1 Tax=Pseudomonas tolaasii TaxID=29442 RepID=UPI001C6073F4|nr:HNH endonuclease [Pseudomonas tolaasii]MBW4795337.1 HNH endonuclease [Pseudomonas tolaasii]
MSSAYAFDLKLVCGGYGYFSTLTLGSAPDSTGLEVRKPSLVNSEVFPAALEELGVSYIIVNNENSYYDWTCIQGWAIADDKFVREYMPHWIKKRKCLISPYGSFTDIELASASIRKRSFRGKFKKRILDRDGNKCINCPETDGLTLQHVRPYSQGGETSFRNLVTLCERCNQNMGAETYRELYDLASLRYSYEPSLLRNSEVNERAILRAAQFSRNIMHTRCELY